MNNIDENDLLIIVACKNPNEIFKTCIHKLRSFYSSKILVVDSESDKNLEVYKQITEKYKNIEVSMAQNKNWEYGAYKYGFEKYPNYKMYLCFQESILLRKKIKLKEKNIYLIPHISGWRSYKIGQEIGFNLIKETKLVDYYQNRYQTRFMVCAHNSFVVDNKTISEIFNTLTFPPSNKKEEMAYERLFGLFFEKYSSNPKSIINISKNIQKIHQNKI